MSLIWPDDAAHIVTDQPRLHALVVGVGEYPHLNGGAGPLAADPLGLSQVTTPPVTARAIAQWLLASYANNACPLGSVELLLSPDEPFKQPDKQEKPVERARMDAIDKAFNRWVKGCSANQNNTAFLYFCGHGLSKGAQFVLPEDFGDPAWADPWKNCIDFDGLRVGMRSCKAQTQLFFVDACRETPFGTLDQSNVSGQALIKAKFSDSVSCSAAYHAAMEGQQAFGPQNDVTYFGQAVMKCLNGAGTINSNGQWVVDTFSLSNALGQMMLHLGRRNSLPLNCNPNVSGMARIHEPPSPYVIASIGCSTPAANSAAEIIMKRGVDIRQSPVGQEKPMLEEVPPGDWEIDVLFPEGQFPAPGSKIYTLMPPIFTGVPVP